MSVLKLLYTRMKDACNNLINSRGAINTITSRLPWEQEKQQMYYYAQRKPFHQIYSDRFSPVYTVAVALVQERISQSAYKDKKNKKPHTATSPTSNNTSTTPDVTSNSSPASSRPVSGMSLSPFDTVVVEAQNIDFQYDSVEQVLDWADIPFILLEPKKATSFNFSPHQTVIINCCEADFDSTFIQKMHDFVVDGGQLVSCDYALSSVLQKAFPDVIRSRGTHLNRSLHIPDHVTVNIPSDVTDDRIIDTMSGEPDHLTYCLELRSDIVDIRDRKRVKKLLISEKLKYLNGEDGILYHFSLGKGEVFHFVPHFFVYQRNPNCITDFDLISNYIKSKGGSDAVVELAKQQYDQFEYHITLDLVRGSTTLLEMLLRIILRQKNKDIILLPDHWEEEAQEENKLYR